MANDPTRARTVFVSSASFASDDPFDIVDSNIAFVNALFEAYFEPREIAEDALTSYYVDYYLTQVNNGGFSQFVYNARWDDALVRQVANGLVQIGARKHAAHFARSREAVAALGAEGLRTFFESGYFGENPVRDALDVTNDEFFAVSKTEDVLALNATWLRALPHLVVCSGEALQAEVDRRAATLPDREARIAHAREREPRATKIIRALCAAAGQELAHVNAGDPTHVFRGERTVAFYFSTNEGLHHMVEVGGRALMLVGRSERIVAEIDVSYRDHLRAPAVSAPPASPVSAPRVVFLTFTVLAAAIVLLVLSRV